MVERSFESPRASHEPACAYCGALFTARRSSRRFCTDRCRLRHWRLLKSALTAQPAEASITSSVVAEIDDLLVELLDQDRSARDRRRLGSAIGRLRDIAGQLDTRDRQIAALRSELERAEGRSSAPAVGRQSC